MLWREEAKEEALLNDGRLLIGSPAVDRDFLAKGPPSAVDDEPALLPKLYILSVDIASCAGRVDGCESEPGWSDDEDSRGRLLLDWDSEDIRGSGLGTPLPLLLLEKRSDIIDCCCCPWPCTRWCWCCCCCSDDDFLLPVVDLRLPILCSVADLEFCCI